MPEPPRFVVMYSGGVGSWAAARRIAEQEGTEGMVLLFTDTLIEDADLYRFLDESADNIGVPLVKIADGRTPWKVFRDRRLLGNSRIAPCSHLLKQVPARKWMEENANNDTRVVLGLDFTEIHRIDGATKGWTPWQVVCPLVERPWKLKEELLADVKSAGIKIPALYREGFPHNNCGGGCVRAGAAQFEQLLRVRPQTFSEWELEEENLRQMLGNVSILRDRRGGRTRPLPLRKLRARIEAQESFSGDDWGGCGCFVSD